MPLFPSDQLIKSALKDRQRWVEKRDKYLRIYYTLAIAKADLGTCSAKKNFLIIQRGMARFYEMEVLSIQL